MSKSIEQMEREIAYLRRILEVFRTYGDELDVRGLPKIVRKVGAALSDMATVALNKEEF